MPTRAAAEEGNEWTQGDRRLRPARRHRRRRRPAVVPRRRVDAGVRRVGADQLRRPPSARRDRRSRPRADAPRPTSTASRATLDEPCSAFVFKVQANMDRNHRDRIAFARICSGRFERGMVMTCDRTGKPFATKYASTVFGAERTTIDEAFPGDVVGLVNATGLQHRRQPLRRARPAGPLPTDPPVRSRGVRHRPARSTPASSSSSARASTSSNEEGVVQVLQGSRLGRRLTGAGRRRPTAVRRVRQPPRHRVQRPDRDRVGCRTRRSA